MLGFGRALGETMAVTMVIGNNPQISLSLFAPQYTMAAVIANEFTEAADELYLHALIEIGLVLFVITLDHQRAVAAAHLVDEPAAAAPADAAGRRRGGRLMRDRWRKAAVGAGHRACAAASVAGGARAARASSSFYVVAQGMPSLNLDFFTRHAGAGRRVGRRHGQRHRRHR